MLTDADLINLMRLLENIRDILKRIEDKISVKSSDIAKIETLVNRGLSVNRPPME